MNALVAADLSPIGLPAGLHFNVPAEVYHQRILGMVSNSALSQMARTPRHYRAWVDGLDKESPALDFGRAFHCALLEPERFAALFPIMPEFSGKGSVALRDAWFDAQPEGAQPIKQDAADKIAAMVASVMSHPVARAAVSNGASEVTAIWQDEPTGLWHKARADYWRRDKAMLLEVKTTRSAAPGDFARAIADYRYHVANALYVEGFKALGEPISHYVMLAVESEAPHCCATYTLTAETEGRGFDLLDRDRERLATCLRADYWPAYSDATTALSLPRWALTD